MAIKHVVTLGYGFADNVYFIPTVGYSPAAASTGGPYYEDEGQGFVPGEVEGDGYLVGETAGCGWVAGEVAGDGGPA